MGYLPIIRWNNWTFLQQSNICVTRVNLGKGRSIQIKLQKEFQTHYKTNGLFFNKQQVWIWVMCQESFQDFIEKRKWKQYIGYLRRILLKPRRITVPKILNRWTITRRQAGRLELSRFNSLGLNKNYDPFVVKWILFYYQIFVRTTSANVCQDFRWL